MTRTPLLVLAAVAALGVTAQPAAAAKKKPSCLRGGATLEARDGGTRIVRIKKKATGNQTRQENVYACWAKTGKRTRVVEEVDLGDDNIARSDVEVVQGRYVGVVESNEGGVSEDVVARVHDAARGKLLHDSSACDSVDQGDFGGVTDVAFLDGGGMAFVCDQLLLHRKAASAVEKLEPLGTDVAQIAVSEHSRNFVQRLFWIVGTDDTAVTKSIALT